MKSSEELAQMKYEAEIAIGEIISELKESGFPVYKVQIYSQGEAVSLMRYDPKASIYNQRGKR